jgi:hypothetical protein
VAQHRQETSICQIPFDLRDCYISGAMPLSVGKSIMIVLGIILSIFAIGFFCWLLFTLAVYALPFFVAMTAAFAAYHHGYNLFGSGLIGLGAGIATLMVGQLLFASVRVTILRAAIALLFAIPAAIAGYHATLGIAHIALTHGALSDALAYIGAILVGATAWSRMAIYAPAPVATPTEAVAGQLSSLSSN